MNTNTALTELHLHDIASMTGQQYREGIDNLVSANLKFDKDMHFLKYPCRLDGYCALVCREGRFVLEINGRDFPVSRHSLVVYIPGNIIRVKSDESTLKGLDFTIVAAAPSFIGSVGVNLKNLYEDSLMALKSPCINLSDKEFELLSQYFALGKNILHYDAIDSKDAIQGLCFSLFHIMESIWKKSLEHDAVPAVNYSRKPGAIFENFMKLVSEYHSRERNVAFYAEKLNLTPKYLSLIVKKLSGKSAPEWIDAMIILEAKNLLKYSTKSIKEIAWDLNFSGSPAFCKFFRAQTGTTPNQFRNES